MSGTNLKDGVYFASSRGFLGDVPVKVTIENGRIEEIEVLPNDETPDFSFYPFKKIPSIIKEYQTLNVDTISGATFCSRALINAITDCVRQAGGDVEALRKVPGPCQNSKEVVEKYCDVCVIGTGGAGSSAAAAAAEKGMKVIVLEKAGYNGGITAAANCMLAVNSKVQLDAGVVLDIEEIFNHMMHWNHYYGNARLISKFLHKTASTVQWLIDKGVEIEYRGREQYTDPFDCPVHFKGFLDHDLRREQLIMVLGTIFDYGGEVYYETRAKSLIKEGKAVTGVRAVREDGSTLIVHAKAVIVATGCFDGNKELAEKYFRDKARFCMPKTLAEGDGLLMCIEAGADVKDAGARVLHLNIPEPALFVKAGEHGITVSQMLAFPAAMLINYRGQRYMNEWLIHNTLASANTNVTQGDNGDFLALFNEKMVETLINEGPQALGVYVVPGGMTFPYTEPGFFKNIKEDLEVCIKVGLCVKGETIEDLAVQLRIDPAVLRSEVERYNAFCKNGRDEDFFKYPELLHAMEEGPYYAVRGTSESLGSVGGVRVDDELRVLTRKREVIPGLYCAGACAGGIWGNDSYGILEGATCSWAFNSGRMAGENAAEYVLSHK